MAKRKLSNLEILQRMADAEERGNRWLADANAARESGDNEKADLYYAKGQFWLDRYNSYTDLKEENKTTICTECGSRISFQ